LKQYVPGRPNPAEQRAKDIGIGWGFAVVGCIGILLYVLRDFLWPIIGFSAANILVTIAALAAIFAVPWVRDMYVRLAMRRYCAKHGHDLFELDSLKGELLVICDRCSLVVKSAPEAERLERIMKDPRLKKLAEKAKRR